MPTFRNAYDGAEVGGGQHLLRHLLQVDPLDLQQVQQGGGVQRHLRQSTIYNLAILAKLMTVSSDMTPHLLPTRMTPHWRLLCSKHFNTFSIAGGEN